MYLGDSGGIEGWTVGVLRWRGFGLGIHWRFGGGTGRLVILERNRGGILVVGLGWWTLWQGDGRKAESLLAYLFAKTSSLAWILSCALILLCNQAVGWVVIDCGTLRISPLQMCYYVTCRTTVG